ncbi:gfo/Idh/MocA family oxidoreductase [candidate division NPL-UPA2 bacterium Unc8]|uniref:Gfo/Idh/MocA family oxidoreductase n=1 Tax=candidate division NPL-UPA2 bacterium Unc8 TaxID=1980939 RepID=A0A399FXM3_UNCN2|nr:scyllo-inositol 2-dehydrogenase (NAD(+)) [Bacillota bacterium]MBT9137532.1 scyllo-inositol 2-dehydrogenase (NAD(+)) [Bacillota bacterium]MBT9146788.1 scyllo-inositol 2-dehydrogenase (NAD(+)) [Bacillota bacterium]RII00984.1 MAG: gfo/Idh/MocA family oxidoreductase [candidate division NPL-UPA2 bacterium Unc8]
MKKIKVAVIGVGHLGKEHARIYAAKQDAELCGVVDIDIHRARKIANAQNTNAFSSCEALYQQVEAVSIAVPTHLHHFIASGFLKQGINVLVEKPITRTTMEADELIRLARKNKVILQVGHLERYNGAIMELEKWIKSPRFIEAHRLAPYQPRGTEVGVVLDLMIHDLDIILYLVNSTPKRIEAMGVTVLSQDEDIANARIIFNNGCVANITSSRLSQERMRKLRIFQDDCYISLDYITQKIDLYQKKGKRIVHEEISPPKREPLALQLHDFLSSVRDGKPARISGEDGKKNLALALTIIRKIHRSAKKIG